MRALLIYFFCTAFVGQILLAQTDNQAKTASADSSAVITLQKTTILNHLMYSNGRRGKLLALDRLSQMVDESELNADDSYLIDVLTALAEQGSAIKRYDKHLNLTNNYVMIRAAAVQVLGKIGGTLISSRLAEVLAHEREPLVMTVAIRAYHDSLTASTVSSVDTLVSGFMRMHANVRDNTMTEAYLDTIKAFADENRAIISPDAIYSVQRIAWDASGYVAPVRNKALSLLLSWL